MKHALLFLMVCILVVGADTPPDNNLPTIGIRINKNETPELSDMTLEHLAMLSWKYFDGVDAWAWPTDESTDSTLKYCETLGMVFVLLPVEMGAFINTSDDSTGLWFRWPEYDLDQARAFAKVLVESGEPDWDELSAYYSGPAFYDSLPAKWMLLLHDRTSGHPAYWFFGLWDEGNTNQRANMVTASEDPTLEYMTYYPDMFTQAWSQSIPPTPTMEEIDPEGVFSWLKWAFDQTASTIPVSTTLGTLLTYDPDRYPGIENRPHEFGTLADMGRCVGAIRDMEFTYPDGSATESNSMPFICFNRYTYRQVDMDILTTMSDSCWLYLVELCEESMDTVVANAGEMPVYFYTQLFGGFGGPAMRDRLDNLDYESLDYRQPSIAEFRMLCNLALLHQMDGVFPYCVRSFHEFPGDPEGDWIACSLLDWDLIPFDAPYEEWVYSGRVQEDVCSPESIPPFDGYDPLFKLSPAPDGGGERQAQNYNEWKYAPFANIWNGIGEVLGEVKTIGPEMRGLGWWARYEDAATIEDTSSTIPAYLTVDPVIKVFTDAGESSCYLYYLNRQCREDGHEFLITCDEDDFPEGVLTEYALDHHRRFIIPVDEDEGVYSFLDTLDAGQGRLVQFVTGISSVADTRVTAPDVWAEGSSGATREYRFTAGEDLDIYARVYNMLTTARQNVSVTLYDITDDSTQIGQTATINLPALSTGGYTAASDTAHFEWSLDGADIGAHLLELRVAKWTGEPDTTDNVVRVAFLVEPRDYSAEVLDDPWDMREAAVSPPAWKTADIDTVYNWDASAWTDSIGGMFEGTIPSGHLDDNCLVLHIPASSLYWIDGDMYNRFSLVGKTTGTAADIMLGWVDSDNDVDSMEVGELAMTYGRTEVIDLVEEWEGLTIKRLWLGFRYPEQPVLDRRVRIGRVWLEEATEP